MTGPKRTPTQRENDLERISALYLKGKRQADIAEELGVTQQQVSYDLKTIHKRWRESTTINLDEAKHRELDRIDLLEQTYWEAWERSLDERTKTRTERNTTSGRENQISRDKASIEKETLLGNPAYLAGVERCIELRCKIIGVYAATKNVNVNVDLASLPDEILERLAAGEDVDLSTITGKGRA